MSFRSIRAYVAAAIVCASVCVGAFSVVQLSGCVYYLNPQCNDQIRNGDETGLDCGGGCGRCNIGDGCRENDDCDDSNCIAGTCTAFACANGAQGENETDVDCGGGECRKCSGGRKCVADSDCFSTCDPVLKICSQLAMMSFAEPVAYPSGDKTYALFSGDLNGDGAIDLVAANEQDSALSVFLNDGHGGFTRIATPFPTGQYPTGGAIADFNHDGAMDVVTADYHGNSISVLLNGSGGVLADAVSYPTVAGAETSNLAVGKLNGKLNDDLNLDLDVVATNPQKASISVFLGAPDGTFANAITTTVGIVGASGPYSAAIADFDGDGFNDVAVGDIVNGPINVLLGKGDGTFQSPVPYAAGGAGPYIILTYDLNLDGVPDLVTADRGSREISVLIGRGDGTFRKAIRSSTSAEVPFDSGPYSLAIADFNRDGVPDVATANYGIATVSILLGIGDGSFEAPIDAGQMGDNSYGVAAGDFDGDGKPDVATANANSDDVTVRLSTSQ
jgi:hypothetical protein